MKEKFTITLVMQLLFLGIASTMIIKGYALETQPEIYISPQQYTASSLHEVFNITVNIKNLKALQRVVGVQFRVQYNATLLEIVNVYEGPFMKQFNNTVEPPYTYFIKYIEVDPYYGPNVLVGILLLPNPAGQWTNFPNGNGTLATITFKAIYRPKAPSPPATCALNLIDTIIVDADLNEVQHFASSGVYSIKSLPIPIMELQPTEYNAILLGELFNVSVNLAIDRDWRLVNVRFRVQYNATLLEIVNVYEGPFMKQFNNTVEPPYTYFIKYIEVDPYYGPNVLVGILLLPNPAGQWTNFPNGNGTLATITFKAIKQPSEGIPLQCALQLNDTILTNDSAMEIPHKTTSGIYRINALTFTYKPLIPSAGEIVTFSIKEPENHAPILYCWDFGDGVAVNVTKPTLTHMYKIPGDYRVTLTCIIEGATVSTTRTISIQNYPPLPLDIDMDVRPICFPSEIVEFNILIKHYGECVDPDMLNVLLYHEGKVHANLTASVQRVNKGLYRIIYEIPGTANVGTYTLFVDARYYIVGGACIKSFSISSTLTRWNALLLSINGTVATVSTDVGVIRVKVGDMYLKVVGIEGSLVKLNSTLGVIKATADAVNLKVVGIEGSLVKLNSTLGVISAAVNSIDVKLSGANQILITISTSLGNIEGYVKDVDDGGLATISTQLGDIKANISELLGRVPEEPQKIDLTLMWVTVVFSILAFITALAILLLVLKK